MPQVALVIDDVRSGQKLAFRYPARDPDAAQQNAAQQLPPDMYASLLLPKGALCNQPFDLVVETLRFVGYPMAAPPGGDVSCVRNDLSKFAVFFVLPDATGEAAAPELEGYREAARLLACALRHEEIRCGYVTRAVDQMMRVRQALVDGDSDAAAVDSQTVIDSVLAESELANTLKDVYHSLTETGAAHVLINRWVQLSLTLSPECEAAPAPMRPFQTLLLLSEEATALASLPDDASPQLRRLIEVSNPLKTFQDLSTEADIPLAQLMRLAAHLVFWGTARVVDTVTRHCIYQVHPDADLDVASPVALKFQRKFGGRGLAELLAQFSTAMRLGDHLRLLSAAQQQEFVTMLLWCLQHDFLYQLHRFVHLMIPRPVRMLEAPPTGAFGSMNMPTALKPHETEYLRRIEATADKATYRLLVRLLPYFDGKHTLEDIMWRENVRRSEVKRVLEAHSDMLLCSLHE